ncbi:MAG: tripartite tricarboxylate transporter substrate binding protein [Limnohabitans sp.]|jgi:tripartite-type tricarboxylate transporter receptor subunit TctC|nr:tripartite tricarboxylate transporter substrate binding protein [Limnohabitans sp.]MDP4734347.1 tripartite tricarboxylate transporter substrate binding protein [Limnohabitans sp.]MDP4772841.1 tripartite tricarboxylate transporter substrate binding protein [Limnohabitans sp.]MDP4922624.1 tripartite tricarboxylate transporter substrate binding protein [Limnohabitans sp.]
MNIKTLLSSLLVAATAFSPALAQTYPVKPISLVVPYPAGGPSDFFARKMQAEATAKLGKTVVVENLGGAGGSIGLTKVANAPADGYTLSLGSPMELVLAPMAIQGVRYKSEDFKLVAQFATTNTILAVRNSLNVKTVDQLLALARKSADKPLSYGSVGPGSLYHLIGEKFSQLTKVDLLHVPYKGIAPLLNDLMGGQIDMAFLPMAGSIPQTVLDGKIQGLAVTAKTPHPLFKQFPAMASMKGLEAMDFDIWAGVQVHKNTPDAVVNTLNQAFYAAAETPENRKALEGSGNVVLASRTPAELARIYQGEIERYRAIAKSINLQAQ